MIFHSNTGSSCPLLWCRRPIEQFAPTSRARQNTAPTFLQCCKKQLARLIKNAARVIASISTHSIIRAHGSNRPCNQGLDTAQPSKKHKANPLCDSALLKAALPSLCGCEDRPIKREFHHPQKTRCQIALEDKHLDCQSVPDRQHPDHLWILSRLSHPCTNGHYIPGFQDR